MKQDPHLSPTKKGINPALVLRGVGIISKLLIFGAAVQSIIPLSAVANELDSAEPEIEFEVMSPEEEQAALDESFDLVESPPSSPGLVESSASKAFSIGEEARALADSAFAIGRKATAGGANSAAIGS